MCPASVHHLKLDLFIVVLPGKISSLPSLTTSPLMLALRVTLRLLEDKPSTHQNVEDKMVLNRWVNNTLKKGKDKRYHCRSVMDHWAMES
jgi:hypothetical protein